MRILDKENCEFWWPIVVAAGDGGWVADSRGWRFNWWVLGDVENEKFFTVNNFNYPKYLQMRKPFSENQFSSKQI